MRLEYKIEQSSSQLNKAAAIEAAMSGSDPKQLMPPPPAKITMLPKLTPDTGGAGCSKSLDYMSPTVAKHAQSDQWKPPKDSPADILEAYARKHGEEAFKLTSIHCCNVSSQLKCSRSLVRTLDIMCTLQDQRITYVRQLIALIEERKLPDSVDSYYFDK